MRSKNFPVFLLYIFTIILASCSQLSKTQKSVFTDFAASAKTFSGSPKVLLSTSQSCIYNYEQFEAANAGNFQTMIGYLNKASKDYYGTSDYSTRLDISFQLMSSYFQALLDLMNVDTASGLNSNISTLGLNIDSLSSKAHQISLLKSNIIGFGTIAAQLAQFVGKAKIRHKELIYMQNFTAKGDILVKELMVALDNIVIRSLLNDDLNNYGTDLESQYKIYLENIGSNSIKVTDLYNDLNPKYLACKNCFARAQLLCSRIDSTSTTLVAAHAEFVSCLNKKKKKFPSTSIAKFEIYAGQLQALITEFQSNNKN